MARNTNIYSNHWVGSAGWGTSKQLRGQTIVSQKSLGPTNEPTEIQVGNRKTMATLVAAGRQTKTMIDLCFKELIVKNKPNKCKNTTWGAFTGQNRKYSNEVFDYGDPENPLFQPENLIMAKGTIEPTSLTTATADVSSGVVAVTYPNTSTGVGQSPTDLLVLTVYNETQDKYIALSTAGKRSDGTWTSGDLHTLGFPYILTDVLRVYASFIDVIVDIATNTITYPGHASDSTNMVATVSA